MHQLSPQIVLVDDDPWTRDAWTLEAKKHNLRIQTFPNGEEILFLLNQLPSDVWFFIDYDLGDVNIDGEELAQRVMQAGYDRVYVATGMQADYFPAKLREQVISKDFPTGLLGLKSS